LDHSPRALELLENEVARVIPILTRFFEHGEGAGAG